MNTVASPDLSIVVPIYNVQEYLPECLESIIAQGIPSYEVILVDDGSTDGSGSIAREYAHKYSTLFHYTEQTNQGLSAARNTGISQSRGAYILFLDSDDFLSESGLKALLELAKEKHPDITIGNFWHYRKDGSKRINNAFISVSNISGSVWLRQSLQQRKYYPTACWRLYRREFLTGNNLFFENGLLNEDQLFTVESMCAANVVTTANIPFFVYRHRSGSITKTLDPEILCRSAGSDLITTLKLQVLCSNNFDKDLTRLVMNHCISLLRTSGVALYNNVLTDDPFIADLIRQVDELKLYRFIRFYRLSHIIDWIALRTGFKAYLAWRSRKW